MSERDKAKTWEVIKFVVPIAITLLLMGIPSVYFYGQQNQKLESLLQTQIELKVETRSLAAQVSANTGDVKVLKNELENIKATGNKTYDMLSAYVSSGRP